MGSKVTEETEVDPSSKRLSNDIGWIAVWKFRTGWLQRKDTFGQQKTLTMTNIPSQKTR